MAGSLRHGSTQARVWSGVERLTDEQAKAGGGMANGGRAHGRQQCADRTRAAEGLEQLAEGRGWEVGERVAVGQHHAADARGVDVEQELADRATGVVAHQGHVVELERLDEGGDLTGDPRGDWSTSSAEGDGV